MKILTDILHHSGTNPEERKLIEDEQEAWRTVNAMFQDKEKAFQKALDEKEKENADLLKQLEELKRKLGEQ